MLSDHHVTIFGSSGTLIADLMGQAQGFCKTKTGEEAVLIRSDSSDVKPASATVYFQCGSAAAPTVSTQSDKYDALAKLKALLDSGALTQDEYAKQKKLILGE